MSAPSALRGDTVSNAPFASAGGYRLPPLHLALGALGDLGANLQRDAHAGIRMAARNVR